MKIMQSLLISSVFLISPLSYSNSELIGMQLENLKNLGVDTSEFEGTMLNMQREFAEEERSSTKSTPSVKPNYFVTAGRPDLQSCQTGEIQLDTICQAAMLRHQAYLTAMAQQASEADIDQLYEQHTIAVQHYIRSHDALQGR